MANFDAVSDLLTRIRNSNSIKSPYVRVLKTKLTCNIVQVLKNEGFIDLPFGIDDKFSSRYLLIGLKYKSIRSEPYITKVVMVSTSGQRVYAKSNKILKVLGGLGVAVLSTSLGIMTDRMARAKNLGGEVLFYIWIFIK